jgi:hypothetical protein
MADHEPQNYDSCAICGRTILRGERVTEYMTTDGERHGVCSLCKTRAEAAGWTPADLAGAPARPPPRRSRGVALRGALSRAAEKVRPPRPQPDGEPEREPASQDAPPSGETPAKQRAKPKGQASAKPKRQTSAKPKAATTSQQAKKPRESQGSSAERRLRRAVERFNESEQAKVVSGLMRSLGEPRASVRSVSKKPPRVAVTVAWELSWYRWEVSQDGEEVLVREVAKGDEVAELADEAKEWNAAVDGDGNVRLARSETRPSPAKAAE